MGRRSTKENKTVYQLAREHAGLTREEAAETIQFISSDRIEKIESEKSAPRPDEILAMASHYKEAMLPNYYCTHECPIGEKFLREVTPKDLPSITLELLSSLHAVEQKKDLLIDVAADGHITQDEMHDFSAIRNDLARISLAIDTLRYWIEDQMLNNTYPEADETN